MPVIIGLIILAAAIFCYGYFIWWLFVGVGPWFIYIVSLLFSIAVPVIYVRVLMRTFGLDSSAPSTASTGRNFLFIFVIALVILIHADFLLVGLAVGTKYLQMGFVDVLQQGLNTVVFESVLNREVMLVARTISGLLQSDLGQIGGNMGYIMLSATIKSTLIVPLVLMIRGFSSKTEGIEQPAFYSYFYSQAGVDLAAVVEGMFQDGQEAILAVNKMIVTATVAGSIFVWPLTIMAYLSLIPPILIAIVTGILLAVMHSLSLAAVYIVAMATSVVLMVAEKAVVLSRSGYAKCPHAQCHEPMPLPIFICSECGARHTSLLPGKFGVFSRTCECGKAQLPTLFWLGKGKLDSICPCCEKPVREELFGGSVHIPVYGGPSAGKTMFLMANAWNLLEAKVPGANAHLIDERTERNYTAYWKPQFESGTVRQKTRELSPNAFLLALKRTFGLPMSVYLYDPAGEALNDEADLSTHRFITYCKGIALLIDPLSIPAFKEKYLQSKAPDLSTSTSREHPEEGLTRVINFLESVNLLKRDQAASLRIAVVLTKGDIACFEEEFGAKIHTNPLRSKWETAGADNSEQIQLWFAQHEPHMLQVLQNRFKEVRFFAVSSLGHAPASGHGFEPKGTMEPLAWLLSRNMVFARPLLGRLLGRTAEVAAAVGVVVLMVVLPIWAALKLVGYLMTLS